MAPLCFHCHKPIKNRITTLGTELHGSSSLRELDPEYWFCRLRCAAEYGVAKAGQFSKPDTDRVKLAMEDKARDDAQQARVREMKRQQRAMQKIPIKK